MNGFHCCDYQERREHYVARILWRIINATLFRITPTNILRITWLKLFGARLQWNHVIYPSAKIFAPWNLSITMGSVIGPRVEVYNKAPVSLGTGVVISQDSYLCTASHDVSSPTMALITKPIVVEDNVWVGARSIILPGVTLHVASVVGAGSVVPKDVDAWNIVGGNPARVIKQRVLAAKE
jgi:putative colanic acid biosynthesis acetyltransferase WcaF